MSFESEFWEDLMSGLKLNVRIVQAIREETSEDLQIRKFIIDMLLEELEHPSRWQFKNSYKKKLREYSKD